MDNQKTKLFFISLIIIIILPMFNILDIRKIFSFWCRMGLFK